jgi:hypothetical protein
MKTQNILLYFTEEIPYALELKSYWPKDLKVSSAIKNEFLLPASCQMNGFLKATVI